MKKSSDWTPIFYSSSFLLKGLIVLKPGQTAEKGTKPKKADAKEGAEGAAAPKEEPVSFQPASTQDTFDDFVPIRLLQHANQPLKVCADALAPGHKKVHAASFATAVSSWPRSLHLWLNPTAPFLHSSVPGIPHL